MLDLLSECTHTLDSVPLDLSRHLADLRELDAVLSASMASITAKLTALTDMIEQGAGKQEQRLWLLVEIADEASRLRLGGEDKIRVACQAADSLKSHSQHLRALTDNIPGLDPCTLDKRTVYPHVATRPFMPPTALEPGRRRRSGFASLLVSAPDTTPLKRKRAPKDDQSPRKVDNAPRPRGGARKRVERPPSPTESLLSVTSHIPPTRPSTSALPRRPRHVRGPSDQPEYYDGHPQLNNNNNPSPFNVPPSSAHPSLSYQHPNPNVNRHATPFDLRHAPPHGHVHSLGGTPAPDWPPPHPQALEGPGMPLPRGVAPPLSAPAPAGPGNAGGPNANASGAEAGGDGEADGDDKLYCFCQRVSFGQMIGCDDAHCQWEWFHIACIGLTAAPEGRWFCEACRSKRNAKRSGRGGRRKAAGRSRAN